MESSADTSESSGFWGGLNEVLDKGLGAWLDYERAQNPPVIVPTGANPTQYVSGQAPVDPQVMNNADNQQPEQQPSEWIPGVSNTVTIVGGVLLLVFAVRG